MNYPAHTNRERRMPRAGLRRMALQIPITADLTTAKRGPMRLSTGEAFCVTLSLFRRGKNANAG